MAVCSAVRISLQTRYRHLRLSWKEEAASQESITVRTDIRVYEAAVGDCATCYLKSRCTQASKRSLARHLYEDALNRMQERITPAVMRMRRCTVEHPFATMKFRIFGHPRLLMRGLSGARIEIGLATMAYNIKRMTNVLGATKLTEALHQA